MNPILNNFLSLVLLILISTPAKVVSDHAGSTNPLDWLRLKSKNICIKIIPKLFRVSVRGEPGVDYPIYGTSSFSLSSFSCDDRVTGVYYADPELRCQVCYFGLYAPISVWHQVPTGLYPPSPLPGRKEYYSRLIFILIDRGTMFANWRRNQTRK